MHGATWQELRAQRADRHAVLEVLRGGMLADGRQVGRLENEIADCLQVPEAVVVASATAGLNLLLAVSGVGRGAEVITSPLTFPGTINAILAAGAAPVFVDCNPEGLSHEAEAARAAITQQTGAACFIGRLGIPTPPDSSPYPDEGRPSGLPQVEDGAYRLASPSIPVCMPTAISLHASKIVSAAMGGVVVGADQEQMRLMRCLRDQGISPCRPQSEGHVASTPGFAFRLSDLNAALARSQLLRLPGLLRNFEDVRSHLGEYVLRRTSWGFISSTPAVLELRVPARHRAHIVESLAQNGLSVAIHYPLVTNMRPWRDARRVGGFPNAARISATTVSIRLSRNMSRKSLRRTMKAIDCAYASTEGLRSVPRDKQYDEDLKRALNGAGEPR